MSTNKQNANFALLQKDSIKKENIQKKLNKLQIFYKLDKPLIKRLILQKKIEKLIEIIKNNRETDAFKRCFDNKQLLYKEAIDRIRKNN